MSATRDIQKRFNLYVDGRGYAGQIEEFQPPTLTIVTDEFRAGDMDAPESIDMGMEALECSFILRAKDPDVIALCGLGNRRPVRLTARAALESVTGELKAEQHSLWGQITTFEQDAWKAGEPVNINCTVKLHYWKQVIDGRELIEIDVRNGIRKIDGVDQMEGIRRIIGA